MTPRLRKFSVFFWATACVSPGLLLTKGAVAQGRNALPLRDPAFVLADEAYKADETCVQGNYESAAEKAQEAYRLRPDVAFLVALARRAQSAQRLLPRNAGEASPPVAEFRPSRRPKVSCAAPGLFAFKAAQAGFGADHSSKFDEAVGKVSIAVRLAPGNSRCRLSAVGWCC